MLPDVVWDEEPVPISIQRVGIPWERENQLFGFAIFLFRFLSWLQRLFATSSQHDARCSSSGAIWCEDLATLILSTAVTEPSSCTSWLFFLDYSNSGSHFYRESSMHWPKQIVPSVGPVFKFHTHEHYRPQGSEQVGTENALWSAVYKGVHMKSKL